MLSFGKTLVNFSWTLVRTVTYQDTGMVIYQDTGIQDTDISGHWHIRTLVPGIVISGH